MRCMFLLISTRFMAFDNASQTIWLQVGFYRCEHGVCLSMYNFPQSNSLTLVCFSSPAGFRTCRECFWVYPRFFLSSALRYPGFLLLRFLSLSCSSQSRKNAFCTINHQRNYYTIGIGIFLHDSRHQVFSLRNLNNFSPKHQKSIFFSSFLLL